MKKLKLPRLSFNRSTALKWLPRFTILASIIMLGYAVWFLYINVLLGVSDVITLESLSQQVLKVKLDVEQFEEVNEDFLNKIESADIDIQALRNPFEQEITTTEIIETPETNFLEESDSTEQEKSIDADTNS